MKSIKVGILYICTGKYSVFWDRFYRNSEKFFFKEKGVEKNYFVFTDDENIKPSQFVHVYKRSPQGFPLDSLMRFEIFLSIQNVLKEMDYLFFLNSNMDFVDYVGKEILPKNQLGLMGVLHPGYYNKDKKVFPYERNEKSTAFIPFKRKVKYHYFMGGFNGGKTDSFLRLCNECNENIKKDKNKGILACFHDESHINKYFFNKDIHILDSSYGYPEDWALSIEPKCIILNKSKHFGNYFIKEYANPFLLPSPFEKNNIFKKAINIIKRKLNK